MKCLCFSDTHGHTEGMIKAVRANPDCEVIFFLGDGLADAEAAARMTAGSAVWLPVRGNCDFQKHMGSIFAVEKTESITLCDKKIVYTHGDLYSVKSSKYGLMELADTKGADVVLFGHTHAQFLEYVSVNSRGVFLFNPGSASSTAYPATYGIIEINEKGIFFTVKNI